MFHLIHAFFGPHLGSWASQLHAVSVSMLALAWFAPLLTAMFRHLPKSTPDIDWIQLWRCPACSTYNRRTFTICTHCEYHLKGGWVRWFPMKLAEFVKRSGIHILSLYRFLGWALFYGLTFTLFWKLHLYSFHQNPLQELLASVTLCLFLLCVWLFYLALRPRFKSPFDALTDLVAGVAVLGLVGFGVLLWSEARTPPNPVLAYVHTQTNGKVVVNLPQQPGVPFFAPVSGKFLKFDVEYSVLTWPLIGIRHVILMRVSSQPLMADAVLWLFDELSSPLKNEATFHPQLILFTQSFLSPPNASLALYALAPGTALTLQKN
jgi:hypothetical protein